MAEPGDSPFLRACRRQPTDRVPVWFMRQAGRALPEYRRLRGEGSILDAVADPALAAEITLQPVRRYGVDAAILFSDIVVPLAAIGFGVDLVPGIGPVIDRPFRGEADLSRLRPLVPAGDVPHVLETVRILLGELDVPLIGFAGAPFTLASYVIEGGPTRDFVRTKSLMHSDPDLWDRLLGALAELSLTFMVSGLSGAMCAALAGTMVDVWHCDALGVYSDATDPSFNTQGQKFLRGYQVTDASGKAAFTTIIPGWYHGRAVHIHFKLRGATTGGKTYEFTSQLFFDDAFIDGIQAQPPYAAKGKRTLRNAGDAIYNQSKGLTLLNVTKSGSAYAATFEVGVQL